MGQSQRHLHAYVAARGRRGRHARQGALRPLRAASERRVSDRELAWIDDLVAAKQIERRFNTGFFTAGDSRDPSVQASGGPSSVPRSRSPLHWCSRSLWASRPPFTLEEFAPRNRWTDLIEVNINNLAAVPSIVFGLLGLAVFINFFGCHGRRRSSADSSSRS
jgi:phosphate transport system permease protein